MNRTTLLALGAATLFALAGCSTDQGDGIASAGGTSTQAAEQVSDEDKAREFVGCMREQGIELPDPEPDGNGGFDFGIADSGVNVDDPAFREAIQACQDKLPGGGMANLDDPELQAQLREFAQCMRDNGIDFPDPDTDGGFAGALTEIDRTSPQFQKAMDACRDKLPQGVGR
jgi:hypothetical protein